MKELIFPSFKTEDIGQQAHLNVTYTTNFVTENREQRECSENIVIGKRQQIVLRKEGREEKEVR